MKMHLCLAYLPFLITVEALRLAQQSDWESEWESEYDESQDDPDHKSKKEKVKPEPPAVNSSMSPNFFDEPELPAAFFYIAMDAVAGSHFMQVNVQSLREHGKYVGPIVFLTDHPACLINNLGTDLLGDKEPVHYTNNVTVFAGPSEGMSMHIKVVEPAHLEFTKMAFEEHKSLAREYAKQAHLPYKEFNLVMMDDDILVTKNVYSFVKSLSKVQNPLAVFEDWGPFERPNSPLIIVNHNLRPNPDYKPGSKPSYHDRIMMNGEFKWQKFHCGMIVAKPGSEECLAQWFRVLSSRFGNEITGENATDPNFKNNTHINKGKKKPKQFANEEVEFDAELEGEGQSAFGSTPCARSGRISFLDNQQFFQWPQPNNLYKDPRHLRTFVHFTNSFRMRSLGGDKVEKFYGKVFNRTVDISHGSEHEDCPQTAVRHTYIR